MPYDSKHGKLWQDIKADVDKTRTWATKFAASAEWAFGKKTARVLAVVVLFAVVVALLFLFVDLYVAPKKPSEKKDLVLAVAQILAGTALLSGLYFTWRTLQVNREGQLTDRFTRAIDQLGATELELRLGGIYALERIDKESPERAYHRTVMDVLTAYIREDSRRDRGESSRPTPASNEGVEQDKGVEQNAKPALRRPPADIQAILNVLSRRQLGGVPKDRVHHLDLRGANLERVSLVGANLYGANLQGTNLQGAALEEANLQRARLLGADLRGANLRGANLQGADLRKAVLREASNLVQAQIEKANGDETTLLPAHLKPPAHWGVTTDEQTEGD